MPYQHAIAIDRVEVREGILIPRKTVSCDRQFGVERGVPLPPRDRYQPLLIRLPARDSRTNRPRDYTGLTIRGYLLFLEETRKRWKCYCDCISESLTRKRRGLVI